MVLLTDDWFKEFIYLQNDVVTKKDYCKSIESISKENYSQDEIHSYDILSLMMLILFLDYFNFR